MKQYTDLTWDSVTDPCRVNCLSDEPSSFHVVQSSESSVLRLFYNLPCRRTRHRELQNSDTGDYVHDRFTALDEYTKGEKCFSFAGGVSCLELAVWRGFGKNSRRTAGTWPSVWLTSVQDRSRDEAIKWAVPFGDLVVLPHQQQRE